MKCNLLKCLWIGFLFILTFFLDSYKVDLPRSSANIIVLDQGVVYSKPDSMFGYCGWPSIIRAHNGDLIIAFSGNRIAHLCPFGDVCLIRSQDEGKTWSIATTVIDTTLDDRDAGLLSLPNGKIAVTTFTNTIAQQRKWADQASSELRSTMHAYLDSLEKDIEEKYYASLMSISDDDGYSFGEPYSTPVTSPHGPILLHDGSMLYIGVSFGKDGIDFQKLQVYQSRNYKTFTHISDIPLIPQYKKLLHCEPHAIQMPDGKIVVHIRIQGKSYYGSDIFTLVQSVSYDNGKTFSIPQELDVKGAPAHLMLHSSGTLISTFGRREDPYGIQVLISKDNAETWEQQMLWDQGESADLGYPASVELDNGDIYTIYYAQLPEQDQTSILYTRWRFKQPIF